MTNAVASNCILTIDDDPEFNRVLKHHLKELPIEVISTETPRDFLERFRDLKPSLCLVDLNIGEYNELGYKLIEAIRKKSNIHVPIVVISRLQTQEKITRALDVGADDYIPKPIDPVTLQSKVERFFNIASNNNVEFRSVPKYERKAQIEVPFRLTKVAEDGLYLKSDCYLPKGTPVKLQSEFFQTLIHNKEFRILTVSNSQVLPDGDYETFLEFDIDDQDSIQNVRNWVGANGSAPMAKPKPSLSEISVGKDDKDDSE